MAGKLQPVLLFVATMIGGAAVGSYAFLLHDNRSAPPIIIDDPRPDKTIVVAVEGAVATPGVYTIRGDSRLQDALRVAGGTTSDADLTSVNLAARLKDEERIVVPIKPAAGEAAAPGQASLGASPAGGRSGVTPTPASGRAKPQPAADAKPININTASAEALDQLPGIGKALAQRIVEYRTDHGPFRTVDDLAQVRGISPRMVADLRPLITV